MKTISISVKKRPDVGKKSTKDLRKQDNVPCVLYGGAETLHFKVAVKNVTDQPQRYKVNLFLDNGKAVGGLIPSTTKKGLVKPGETDSFVYPVKGMDHQAKSVMLRISTMSK